MTHSAETPRPRLLFVDDEFRVLVSLKSIFRNDYEVRTANGGAQALEVLRDWTPDVIVSDQRMPAMTGAELLKQVAEQLPQVTRVLLTGYSDLEAIISSINEGEIFRFVSKPWRRGELIETIEAALRLSGENRDAVAAPPPAEPAPQASATAGVLVLDPDPGERAALLQTLNGARPAFAASSVAEALTLLQENRIGTVITEAVIDGEVVTSLVNGLRQLRPDLVYIVLTHQPDAQHMIDLINHGQIYRVLRKPLNAGLLRGAVNMASRRHEILQTRPDQARRITLELAPIPVERRNTGMLARLRQLLHV